MRETKILHRSATPRQITLPNGKTFVARYERTSRQNLPRNVTVRRTRRIGPRNQQKRRAQLHRSVTVRQTQKGASFLSSGLGKFAELGMKFGLKNLSKKGLDVESRALTSKIGQKLIDEETKHAPELYKSGISKIENNNLKKTLESDVANYIVEKTRKKEKKKRSK